MRNNPLFCGYLKLLPNQASQTRISDPFLHDQDAKPVERLST